MCVCVCVHVVQMGRSQRRRRRRRRGKRRRSRWNKVGTAHTAASDHLTSDLWPEFGLTPALMSPPPLPHPPVLLMVAVGFLALLLVLLVVVCVLLSSIRCRSRTTEQRAGSFHCVSTGGCRPHPGFILLEVGGECREMKKTNGGWLNYGLCN